MKYLLPVLLLSASLSSFAQTPADAAKAPGKGMTFAEMKAKVVEVQQKQIQAMQTNLSCTQAAQDHNAIKACREQHHQSMRAMMPDMKPLRKGDKMHGMHKGDMEGMQDGKPPEKK